MKKPVFMMIEKQVAEVTGLNNSKRSSLADAVGIDWTPSGGVLVELSSVEEKQMGFKKECGKRVKSQGHEISYMNTLLVCGVGHEASCLTKECRMQLCRCNSQKLAVLYSSSMKVNAIKE